MTLLAFVQGIGVLGPGFSGWPRAAAALAGRTDYAPQPTVLPAPATNVVPAAAATPAPGPTRRALPQPLDPIFNSVPDEAARQRMISHLDMNMAKPDYALAYSGLADVYFRQQTFSELDLDAITSSRFVE